MSYVNVIECPECGSDDITMGAEAPDGKRGISNFKYSQRFTCNGDCKGEFEINYNMGRR